MSESGLIYHQTVSILAHISRNVNTFYAIFWQNWQNYGVLRVRRLRLYVCIIYMGTRKSPAEAGVGVSYFLLRVRQGFGRRRHID